MAARQATFVPSVKPSRGMTVNLSTRPGCWQISDKSPTRGHWWLVAVDAVAKASGSHYAEANGTQMTRINKLETEK